LDFTETDPPYQNPLANYEDVTFLLPQAVMEKDIVKTLFLDALALDDEYTLNFEAVYFAALVYVNQDLYNKYNDMYGIQEGTVSGEQSFEDTIYTLIEHWMPLAGGGE
jgi:hypothetical protein